MYFKKSREFWNKEYPDYWRSVCKGELRKEDGPSGGNNLTNFLDFSMLDEDSHVLDACCGQGRMIEELLKRKVKVKGIDISVPFIDEVNRKFEKETHFIGAEVVDISGDSFFKNSFDKVLCFSSFDCLEQKKALDYFFKALKIGGSLIFHAKNSRYEKNDNQALFAERKALENSFPISFIDFEILHKAIKQNASLDIEKVYFFKKRGDLANWNYHKKQPEFFYEFLISIKKSSELNEEAWPDFSKPFSNNYKEAEKNKNSA